jgi:hypothetical protein
MKRFYGTVLFFAFVLAAAPAFASLNISVVAIEQFSDGADISIVIYEDGIPAAVDFSFQLHDGYDVVNEGSGSTGENGEAVIGFSGFPSDAYFEGEIWVGDYDDPEASQTFSFSTEAAGCNAGGIGIGSIGPIWLALIGLALKKKRYK